MRRTLAALLLALTACSSGGSSDASVQPEDVIYGPWTRVEGSWDDSQRTDLLPSGFTVFIGDPEDPTQVPMAIALSPRGSISPSGFLSMILDDRRGLTDQTTVTPTSTFTQVYDHLGRILLEYGMQCDDDWITMGGNAYYTEPGPASFGGTYRRDPGRRP